MNMQRGPVTGENLCERVAEAIFLELIGKTEHHFEIAQHVVQYLDTSPNIEKSIRIEITVPISLPPGAKKGHCKSVIDGIQQKLAQNFGGFTTTEAMGGWYDGDDKLVEEPSRKISTDLPIGYWVHVTDILKAIIVEIQEKLKQRCVFVSIHNTSQILNLVENSDMFPSQDKFQGTDPEILSLDKSVKPRKPDKSVDTYVSKNDDVENLKAELAHLKKKIQQVVMEDNQINSEKKSVEIDDIFAGTLEIGARVLSMGAVKLTELGDIAFSTGKTTTAELYYFHAKSKYFNENNLNGYADVLIDLANVCFRRGMFEAARSLIEESMAIFVENNYDSQRGIEAIFRLGDTFALQNDVERAWLMYSHVAKIAIENSDYDLIASSQIRLANVSQSYEKRVELYRDALAIHQKFLEPKSMTVAGCLLNLGYALQGTGEYIESRDVIYSAKKMSEELEEENLDFTYQIHEKLADLEKNEGNYNSALMHSKQALGIARRIENPVYECTCLTTIANIFHLLRDPQKSEEFNELVLEVAKENDLPRYIGQYYGRAAQIAVDKNQLDVAKSLLKKEQELCYSNEFLYDAMFSELFLAQILLDENNPHGMEHLQKGMKLGEKLNQFSAFKLGTTMLVNQMMNLGIFADALELNNELVKSLENRGGSKHDLSVALHNSGLCLYYQSMESEALEYFTKSEEAAQHIEDKHHYCLLLANIGRTHARLKNLEKAINYFTKALEIATQYQYSGLVNQIQKEIDSTLIE